MARIVTGTKADDFVYRTVDKEGIRFSEKVKEADKTLLIFLRYLGCRTCMVNMLEYAEAYDRFKAKNAQIVLVLQSSKEIMEKQTLFKKPVPYDIVLDPTMELYQIYELNVAESKEQMADRVSKETLGRAIKMNLVHGEYEGEELQLPGVFLVDAEMNVLYDRRAVSGGDIPNIEEMLEMV